MDLQNFDDDPTVADETLLYRRVPEKPDLNIVWDSNLGHWRPSSASFKNDRDGSPMSVCLQDTLEEAGREPVSVLEGHPDFALAAISAGNAREYGQKVVRDPLPTEPAHGLVAGEKKKRIMSNLAKSSVWVIPPKLNPP
jgi:hypothetical protein